MFVWKSKVTAPSGSSRVKMRNHVSGSSDSLGLMNLNDRLAFAHTNLDAAGGGRTFPPHALPTYPSMPLSLCCLGPGILTI